MAKFAQRYALEREIGAGGMARVFLGRDEVLDRSVAIKILKPGYSGTEIGDRFRREGRTAASLSHPNIVSVYGAGEGVFEGREVSYIVMEYVPGGDLKASLDTKGPLPDARLARLGAEVSSGLAQAHEKGVIHRDIKPHNVLIDSQGHSKLTDFGIARALDTTQATQTGAYLGTALYSSPEQLQGEKVTPKSDVYSLGITLYQAATGEAPFAGTPIEVASQHMNKTPVEPSALGASLSGTTEALILDCIRKDPDFRPTAEEVHDRFLDAEARAAHPARAKEPLPAFTGLPKKAQHTRAYSSEATTAKPPPDGAWREADRSRRRRGLLAILAALLLLLLGIIAYAAIREGGSSDTAQAPAPQEASQQALPPKNTEAQPAGGGTEGTSAGGGQENTDTTSGTSGGGATKEAAEQTVREFYQTAVDKDFGRNSGLMTPEWRQKVYPEQGQFEGTYKTLKSIEWAEGPAAQVSGDTATVTGVTIARHTDRTERNSGTWWLVYQNGEWRINGWQVGNLSTGPP